MATAGFRSRRAAEDAGSSTRGGAAHRRSRSLSRFPPPTPDSQEFLTPRGRFVNKVRGSGQILFPEAVGGAEISLDDLADEFLRARAESEDEEGDEQQVFDRGISNRRMSSSSSRSNNRGVRYLRETESSRRRGRSVSRPPDTGRNNVAGPTRTRHSSVVDRSHGSRTSSENDANISNKTLLRKNGTVGPTHQNLLQKPSGNIRRSLSQRDFSLSQDSSSSHSSLTDEEARGMNEKTIRAVYAKEKEPDEEAGLYEAMRKEVRNAVQEIRTQLEKVMTKTEPVESASSDDIQPIQVIAELRRNYTSKLEESEKRKQELLAELAAEEQRGQELTKIVKELLPSPPKTLANERQSRARRRSRERTRVSRGLTEEAERYFEDFLSNVEDTDFSSFDGERSDTSSTKIIINNNKNNKNVNNTSNNIMQELEGKMVKVLAESETDGVVLPWLQWETSNDLQSSPCETNNSEGGNANSNHIAMSSRGSWSPSENGNISVSRERIIIKFGELGHSSLNGRIRGPTFCKDEYLDLKVSEDLLFERFRQRQRLESGSIVLCDGRWL